MIILGDSTYQQLDIIGIVASTLKNLTGDANILKKHAICIHEHEDYQENKQEKFNCNVGSILESALGIPKADAYRSFVQEFNRGAYNWIALDYKDDDKYITICGDP